MAKPPTYTQVAMDNDIAKKIKWDDKKVRNAELKTLGDTVSKNSDAREAFRKEARTECENWVRTLEGIANQLEKKANTQDFKITGAKALRDNVKATMQAVATDAESFKQATLDFRGMKIKGVVTHDDAVKTMEKIRAEGQNTDKVADGMQKAIISLETSASALMKVISARAAAYGNAQDVGKKFKDKADALFTKFTKTLAQDGKQVHLRAANALGRVQDYIDKKEFDILGHNMNDIVKNETAFEQYKASVKDVLKAMTTLRDKCPDPNVQGEIKLQWDSVMDTLKWYNQEAVVLRSAHKDAASAMALAGKKTKNLPSMPECLVTA